jgi:hypothetical protein
MLHLQHPSLNPAEILDFPLEWKLHSAVAKVPCEPYLIKVKVKGKHFSGDHGHPKRFATENKSDSAYEYDHESGPRIVLGYLRNTKSSTHFKRASTPLCFRIHAIASATNPHTPGEGLWPKLRQ